MSNEMRVEVILEVGAEKLEARLNELLEDGRMFPRSIRVQALQTTDPAVTKYILIYPRLPDID